MATQTQLLTLEQFRTRYHGQKPRYEYWHGEAIKKTTPTSLHGLIQFLIASLLKEAGYKAGIEVELRLDQDWQPVPDVIGMKQIEQPYPTKLVEIVVEILSPDDRQARVLERCEQYSRIGIGQVFVVDPEHRGGFEWDVQRKQLGSVTGLCLANGRTIELAELWSRLKMELQPLEEASA